MFISPSKKINYIWYTASVSTIFIFSGLFLYPPPNNLDISLFVRTVGIILFWLITYEFVHIRKTNLKLEVMVKEKETLMKEIHHRVKNNLQIVTSLLNMQSRSVDDPLIAEYFKQAQNRVKAMSSIHEKLYQTEDFYTVDFGHYIKQLAANIFQTYSMNPDRIIINFDFDNMLLNMDLSVPCGLIINELITNSLKHAFPSNTNGQINISLKKNGKDYSLLYKDNGVGFSKEFDEKKANTLGMMLIMTLTKQIHGNIKIDHVNGTSYTITFQELPQLDN